jgi:hypothetical protein
MTKNTALENNALAETDAGLSQLSRRNFLRWTSASAGLVVLASCSKDNDVVTTDTGVNLGSGDVGILNYAYALEQLEAAFYIRVAASFPADMTDSNEKELFTQIRDHEVAHREFFKKALGSSAIPALEVDFSSIDFTKRATVLATAKSFEDLGVSAYNGAGQYLTTPDYLVIAGKIVSVEARHAALIRDRISNGTFAGPDAQISMGLDKSRTPSEVFAIAGTYIKTKINASNLPS